jgi:thiol-disulfide isomerase/thioredoxin
MNNNRRVTVKSVRRAILFALIGGLIGLLLVQGWWRFQERDRTFLASTPLEFPANGDWINADRPLRFADLHGKVVLMQFSFVGCVFCRKMDPYLCTWSEQFGTDGLVVVEVNDGNIDTLDKVREWAARDMIPYPLFYDAAGVMAKAYGIHGYPSRFLVGRDGKVEWEDHGWGGEEGVAKIEMEIRRVLGRD